MSDFERIKSGVRNFDRLLGGGIPRKETILVEGAPGSGKTNLGLEFLYRGWEQGDKGLYVSFQDSENEILRTTTFNWDFEKAVENGDINIITFDPYRYEKIADMLRSSIKQNEAERVVLDPITDLDLYIGSRKDQRKTLLEIKDELRDLNCTTLLIAEEEESTELEEEVADGILQMKVIRKEGELKRQMYVKKLKGTDFTHSVHKYKFDSEGLKVQ